jgi:hypothetical protein
MSTTMITWKTFQLVAAGEDSSHCAKPISSVKRTLAAGDQHVRDDADAPAVRGWKNLNHFVDKKDLTSP